MDKHWLPTPEELAQSVQTVKTTLSLTESTVDAFKEFADKSGTQYQTMIRNFLHIYSVKAKQLN